MFVADTDGWYLWRFDLDDLRQGIFDETQHTAKYLTDSEFGSDIATTSIASDGQGTIVIGLGKSSLRYSLDHGTNWNSVTAKSNVELKYIGSGRFVFTNNSNTNGIYYYWKKSNPTTYYSTTYKLSDNSYPYNGGSDWLRNMWVTETDRVFTLVRTSTTPVIYYGSLTKASGKIGGIDRPDRVIDITYAYNKYWATAVDGNLTYVQLYYSNDGINFIKVKNGTKEFFRDRGGTGVHLDKNNGQLCFYGNNGCGIIKSNYSVEYTEALMQTANSAKTAGPSHSCNKFHKY